MRQFIRDTEHLFRLAGLFVVGGLVFLVARGVLVPSDFGEYGHFRTGGMKDNAARTPVFAGRESCGECHDDVLEVRVDGGHETVGCEACHGALGEHALDPFAREVALPDAGEICRICHLPLLARPDGFPQVDPEEHADDDPCSDCHEPHHPRF